MVVSEQDFSRLHESLVRTHTRLDELNLTLTTLQVSIQAAVDSTETQQKMCCERTKVFESRLCNIEDKIGTDGLNGRVNELERHKDKEEAVKEVKKSWLVSIGAIVGSSCGGLFFIGLELLKWWLLG